ncbi:hypothetical protein CERSUDRAFT_151217 [Gelatoporia subvermispora B]|uniref:DUF6535 domain-containing protein n=1 Tax=Ceriporiopsis subvermispora (strain B) TaxID=914234 RepID=M2RMV1_CERS8|nr:hypothetical protein CERSUDRAFT_151217 [Gelatoporia subvermispora B]
MHRRHIRSNPTSRAGATTLGKDTSGEEESANQRQAWDQCVRRLRVHDEGVAHAWKEEIEIQHPSRAGLVSAILTAFNVEISSTLQPNPVPDLNTQILLQISAQLSNLSVNSESMPFIMPTQDELTSSSSIWVNALWFSNLILSLASASLGIVVRQWLN